MSVDENAPVFVISVAAELAGMHPQTLRQYDRLGLVSPSRAPGKSRRYSSRDIQQLREIQRLSQEGVTLIGIKRILILENEVSILNSQVHSLRQEVQNLHDMVRENTRVFAAGVQGDIIRLSPGQRLPRIHDPGTLVVWSPTLHRF